MEQLDRPVIIAELPFSRDCRHKGNSAFELDMHFVSVAKFGKGILEYLVLGIVD